METPEKTIEIDIVRVGYEGQGVGYDPEGNAYFVQGGVPGDRVRIAYRGTKKYRDAEILDWVRLSAERDPSPCNFFQKCGGCDWLGWGYEAQLAAKRGIVAHILSKADWEPETLRDTLPSPMPLGYRNRVQLRAAADRLGFYRRRSHDIVDIDRCAVADDRINQTISKIREREIPFAQPRKIELALADSGIVRSDNRPHASAGFAQVNSAQNAQMVRLVADDMKSIESRRVLELYCGNGNFTRAYGSSVERVFGIDSNEQALASAQAWADSMVRAGEATPEKFSWLRSFVSGRMRIPAEFLSSYDTLLLDPPRAGCGIPLDRFVSETLRHVLYVSCSPLTFVRDIQCLKKHRFRLVLVQPVDMFPQTRHVELYARFSR